MPTTVNYSFPYPALTDAPNGPTQLGALAVAVDSQVKALDAATGARIDGLGRVTSTQVTADSATWNSATKVATNLAVSFTAVAGAIYRVTADVTFTTTAVGTTSYGLVWRAGASIAATDALIAAKSPRVEVATGLNAGTVVGEFTASTNGTHATGVVGWNPTGDTCVVKLKGDPAYAINQIFVDRVK